jgi:hypothetical protein
MRGGSMHKFSISWETTISPVRPYYSGEVVVMADNEEEARSRAIHQLMRKNAFSRSDIRIVNVL